MFPQYSFEYYNIRIDLPKKTFDSMSTTRVRK